jgi:hypothetical protein
MGKGMEDKRKLTAAIMGAIIAYLHVEQQSSSVIPAEKSQPGVNRQRNPATNNSGKLNNQKGVD